MDNLHGYIERITFQNEETGFTVAQLKVANRSDLVCIVGTMAAVQPGETIRCSGFWKKHLVFGSQFEVKEFRQEAPATCEGIRKYLGSGLIKGIGRKYADRIVDKFDLETLNIIDETPERLLEIDGIGKKRVEMIRQCWEDQKTIRDVMIFLQSHNISPTLSQKLFKAFGKDCLTIVKENPYRLAREVRGIGFKTADALAAKLGMAHDAPQRIEAGIEYLLMQLSDEGHVCYPLDHFIKYASETLEVGDQVIQPTLDFLQKEERIVVDTLLHDGVHSPFVWLKGLHQSETGIARELKRLLEAPCSIRPIEAEKALAWVQEKQQITLAENQRKAVAAALTDKVHIITGGPGTGKSTITKAILGITEKLTQGICLCAPTGRAAKRMTEITGKPAKTIHSLLEIDFKQGGFKRNKQNPIDCELLIVDEASMIDTSLMYSLLKAVPSHARLLLVGDINQLPSVGPGNVLKDIIQSRAVPVTMLTEIFRQAAGSRIITNAHMINKGMFPEIAHKNDSDFYFFEGETPEEILKQIIGLVSQRLPKKFGFNPKRDIQVLAPMKRGEIGTENLNTVLQETLNPKEDPLIRFGRKFSPGDKVMQLRNDYKREVFNGDIGTILKIDQANQQVIVTIDERDVLYDFSDLDDLVLAYAVSIHKYQGSECPCVIIPVHTTHFKLLHRNLLYTGVTRGKKLVILIGTPKALSIAVRNDEVKKRYTGLLAHLHDRMAPLMR